MRAFVIEAKKIDNNGDTTPYGSLYDAVTGFNHGEGGCN